MRRYLVHASFVAMLFFSVDSMATDCHVGIGAGRVKLHGKFLPSKLENDAMNTPGVTASRQVRNTATVEEVSVGCMFNEYVGVSATYLPNVNFSIDTNLAFATPPTTMLGVPLQGMSTSATMSKKLAVDATGLFLDLVVPINDSVSVTAQGGGYLYSATLTTGVSFLSSVGPLTLSQSERERGRTLAGNVGIRYTPWKNLALYVKYLPGKHVSATVFGASATF